MHVPLCFLMHLNEKSFKMLIFWKLLKSSFLLDMFNLMWQWLLTSSKGQGWPFSQGSSYWSHINISKLVFSETIRQIELNLYMKTPYDKLAKIYTNYSGHMTKMANMPIYCKNALTKSSRELEGPWPWNLVCSICMWGLLSLFKWWS